MRVTVVGAGVVGLSSAIAIAEAGLAEHIAIIAEDWPPESTTSVGSGALWRPVFCEDPMAMTYAVGTFERLVQMHRGSGPSTGISMVRGRELYTDAAVADPEWRDRVFDFQRKQGSELPPGLAQHFRLAHEFGAPMMNPPKYLPHLIKLAQGLGIELIRARLDDLEATTLQGYELGDVVINCTGGGATSLVTDPLLKLVKGQTVKVMAPSITEFMVAMDGPLSLAYILPRGDGTVVLGGTHEENPSSSFSTAGDVRDVLDRCTTMMPSLRSAQVIDCWSGLRPERPLIRLEPERLPSGRICIHNYGHGGCGMTLHWGCAAKVVGLVKALGWKAKL